MASLLSAFYTDIIVHSKYFSDLIGSNTSVNQLALT